MFDHVDVDILTQRCQADMLTVPLLLLSNLNPLPCFHIITLTKGWTQNGEMLLHVGSLPLLSTSDRSLLITLRDNNRLPAPSV